MGKHWDVIIKVAFYIFDVVSDWLNGWNLLNFESPINVSNATSWTNLNVSLNENSDNMSNATTTSCLDSTESHTWWGVMTIGVSWIPALFAMIVLFGVKKIGFSLWHPLLFILWPLLLPFHM